MRSTRLVTLCIQFSDRFLTNFFSFSGPHVMPGYYQNEEATKECFTEDSWFRTGDVVYFDESGDIFIVDRIKDMIKVKGYQVSPTEVEEEIRKVPGKIS